jgi:hypothetical protein
MTLPTSKQSRFRKSFFNKTLIRHLMLGTGGRRGKMSACASSMKNTPTRVSKVLVTGVTRVFTNTGQKSISRT